jgi:polysaccharide export outer membrane protein
MNKFGLLCVGLSLCGASWFGTAAAETMESNVQTNMMVTSNYIIGPQDVLEISVWRNPDLSRQVSVRPDGRISLPLIGDVMAVGRDTTALKDEITDRLKSYKENPTVAIVVQQVNSYFVYVQGAVGSQGRYPLLTKTSLIQAITLAGGLNPDAVRSRIVVFRMGGTAETSQRMTVNYDDIVLRGGENFELQPGDTIVVPSETMVLLP